MDNNLWSDFGKNISVVKDFNYFPEEWRSQNPDEEFIDFANKYKKDFNSNNEFSSLVSLVSFDTNFTGFYNILLGKIELNGEFHDADFVYLKNGKLKYSQSEYGAREGIRNIEQIFYDDPFYISKKYYSDNRSSEEEMINSYGDLNEDFMGIENSPKLLCVQRGGKFCWEKGFSLRYAQWGEYCSSIFLYKKGEKDVYGELVFNSESKISDFQYLEEIKKNPFLFKDFNLLKDIFGELEVNSPFPIFGPSSKRRRKLKVVLEELKDGI